MAYAQTEKYSLSIKDKLMSELTGKSSEKPVNQSIIDECKACESVCVHIRRGDYIKPKNKDLFYVCTMDYYKEAVLLMLQKIRNPRFYIFSDDIDWVEKNMEFLTNYAPIYIRNGGEDAVCMDMDIMKSCKHFIMSNSSLSWWAQYLSENTDKVVIAPSRWLNDNKSHSEVYQENWSTISV